jgi:hypothetical protein
LLELRGLADEMVRLGNPGLAASFYGGGKRIFRLDFTRIDSRYHYLLFISQAETERILRPDGYVGFASGEHAWTRRLDAYCRLWLSALAQAHTHAG